MKDYGSAITQYKKKKAEWDAQRRRGGSGKKTPEPTEPFQRIQEGEDENFLCFAAALKILVGSAIRVGALPRAKELLEKYLLGFLEVYFHVLAHKSRSHAS